MSTAYGILQLLYLLHYCLCSVNIQYITVRKITSEAFSTMYIYFAEKIHLLFIIGNSRFQALMLFSLTNSSSNSSHISTLIQRLCFVDQCKIIAH